jgi:glutaredoxin
MTARGGCDDGGDVLRGDGGGPSPSVGPRAGMPMMAIVTVYSKPDCHLCADALNVLRGLQAELGYGLCERDITEDEALHRSYFERIPVVTLDGEELCEHFVDEQILRERLESRR